VSNMLSKERYSLPAVSSTVLVGVLNVFDPSQREKSDGATGGDQLHRVLLPDLPGLRLLPPLF